MTTMDHHDAEGPEEALYAASIANEESGQDAAGL
jgi:hypothetical protein